MMNQEFQEQEQEHEYASFREDSEIAQLLHGKTSLDKVLGKVPHLKPVHFPEIDIKGHEESADLEKKYFGTAEETVEVEREGIIGELYKRMKTTLLGGTEEIVQEATPGILNHAEEVIFSGREILKNIAQDMDSVKKTVASERKYVTRISEELDKSRSMYVRLEKSLKHTSDLRAQARNILEQEELSTEQRIRAESLVDELTERIHRIKIQYSQVACRINDYRSQRDYLGSQIRIADLQLSDMEISTSNLESKLAGAELNVRGQRVKIQREAIGNKISKLNDHVDEYLRKVHQLNRELGDKSSDISNRAAQPSYSLEQRSEISDFENSIRREYETRVDEIHSEIEQNDQSDERW